MQSQIPRGAGRPLKVARLGSAEAPTPQVNLFVRVTYLKVEYRKAYSTPSTAYGMARGHVVTPEVSTPCHTWPYIYLIVMVL